MTEHEYRLNRNEWLYKEIKDYTENYDIADSFLLALIDAEQKEPNCKRIKQYIQCYDAANLIDLLLMADMWESDSKGIEDCMEWFEVTHANN